ncbi:MASE1 domain-containing protein [Streptomyces ferralitis]|uniref:MASE1 domain-containing protein n=1 Tax=Streptantibioticus ferralitis TaxID=236510 RepID=A0ABT5YUM4_9ACTN|nr:MASE1 domain-containing protein [Streptantibioticus ferralitis]MDF2255031.1 MASE1 domain-containing protein [Streptantibioticus ferralitis]
MVPGEGIRRYRADALRILALAAVYYGGGELGLIAQQVRGQVTPLWPPTGIALAALLLFGLRIWPGIALGAFLVNVAIGPSAPAVLGIVAGNTLAPVCSYLLLRRAGFRAEVDRLQDALALVFLGALLGMMVSATVGSGVLALAGVLPARGFWPTWSVWWTGDAMGVLVVTPVLLVLRRARWPRGVPLSRWVEALLLVVATPLVAFVATRTSSLLFLAFPIVLWAAFRFQRAGAAPCALAISTIAISAAASWVGPFAHHDLFHNMVTVQAFNGAVALTALLISATITQRNKTHEQITRLYTQFSEVMAQLDPGEMYRLSRPEDRTEGDSS